LYYFSQNSVDYAVLGATSKLAAILLTYPFQVQLSVPCFEFISYIVLEIDISVIDEVAFTPFLSGYACPIAGTEMSFQRYIACSILLTASLHLLSCSEIPVPAATA